MTSNNRADRIEQLFKSIKKHFRQTAIATDRPVLDLLIYACCLEDTRFEQADEAFARLQQSYFDWNEVRVTTVAELSEVLQSVPQPTVAASRVKKNLQAMFESRYSFDMDDMKKMNLGKATSDLEAWSGMTKFILGFVTQHALGGHAIPIDGATVEVLRICEVITLQEAEKNQVPGLDRAISKSKGPEFASLLHQFGAEYRADPKSAAAQAVFKELGVVAKARPTPPKPEKAPVKSVPAVEAVSNKKPEKSIANTKKDAKSSESTPIKSQPSKAVTPASDSKSVKANKKMESSSPVEPAQTASKKPVKTGGDDKSASSKKTTDTKTDSKSDTKKSALKPSTDKSHSDKSPTGKATSEKTTASKTPSSNAPSAKASTAKAPASKSEMIKPSTGESKTKTPSKSAPAKPPVKSATKKPSKPVAKSTPSKSNTQKPTSTIKSVDKHTTKKKPK